MYTPTEQELKDMGFEYEPYFGCWFKYLDDNSVQYGDLYGWILQLMGGDYEANFIPKDRTDVESIIRMFTF
jgi:hypothetical protein